VVIQGLSIPVWQIEGGKPDRAAKIISSVDSATYKENGDERGLTAVERKSKAYRGFARMNADRANSWMTFAGGGAFEFRKAEQGRAG
jgi:hypothetical protein